MPLIRIRNRTPYKIAAPQPVGGTLLPGQWTPFIIADLHALETFDEFQRARDKGIIEVECIDSPFVADDTEAARVQHINERIAEDEYLQSQIDAGAGGTGAFFEAECYSTDLRGYCVKIIGAGIGDKPKVQTANPSSSTLMPAAGVIVQKTTPTICIVQRLSIVNMTFGGVFNLIPGRRAFVGFDGRPTSYVPRAIDSPSSYVMIQTLGVAVTTERLDLIPSTAMFKLVI